MGIELEEQSNLQSGAELDVRTGCCFGEAAPTHSSAGLPSPLFSESVEGRRWAAAFRFFRLPPFRLALVLGVAAAVLSPISSTSLFCAAVGLVSSSRSSS